MRVEYHQETDIMTITFRDAKVKESDELRSGVILDFGFDDQVVGMEILNASKVVEKTREINFAIAS